jgi:DMSO/TMAO reductase YedYZ molybdopterin-dependent catalytic subunit
MGFFDRNRAALESQGVDPARLPPGQYFTERFPVLHAGSVPEYPDLSQWDMRIFGLVDTPRTLSWPDLLALPKAEVVVDIHCVTKWSKFDTPWRGVPFEAVFDLVHVDPSATHVMWHSEYGFTANVPLADLRGADDKGQPRCLLAYEFDGRPLEAEHGYPLRSSCPGSTSGSRPSGCAASSSWPRTSPASGSATGTTCTATRSSNNATGATETR